MDELTLQLRLTDALLLDAIEGIDSIATRLAVLHDRLNVLPRRGDDVAVLAGVLAGLGWWSGRLQGAISTETAKAIKQVTSGGA